MKRLIDKGIKVLVDIADALSPAAYDILMDCMEKYADYINTGLEPSEVVRYKAFADKAVTEGVTMAEIKRFINEEDEERPIITDIPIKHLVELGRAEQDGLLVVLPCKEGDTVYVVTELCSDTATVEEGTVESFGFDTAVFVNVAFGGLKRPQTWGKTVFGSREEADAALAQRERGSDNA